MRYQGSIHDWNDERGFGFVTPGGGGERAFVHVNAFQGATRRPANGQPITYEVQRDAKGRLNAYRIRHAGSYRPPPAARADNSPRPVVAVIFLVLIGAAWLGGWLPGAIPLLYAAMSLLSAWCYWIDKQAAKRGGPRTPEASLHLVDLLCGWPGGLIAQAKFRHKSSKSSFRAMFWFTVIVNLVAVTALALSGWVGALQMQLLG